MRLFNRFIKKKPGDNLPADNEIQDILNKAAEYHNQGDLENARKLYEQVLEKQPEHPYALNLIGVLYSQIGQFDEAINQIKHAISIKPDDANFYNNLGVVFYKISESENAIDACNKSLQLNPESVSACYNLGNACYQAGKYEDAIDAYNHAIDLNGNHADACYNLGNAYRERCEYENAKTCFEKTLALNGQYSDAANNLARIYELQGKFNEAIENYRRAIVIEPDNAETHSNLLYCLNYIPGISEQAIYEEHRQWASSHRKAIIKQWQGNKDNYNKTPLRTGYVSADLRRHSVASFMEPLFREHDRKTCEIFVYFNFDDADPVTAHLQTFIDNDKWRNIASLNDDEVVRQIMDDRIDILIDLNGHTAHNRLPVFSCKPAPVQISYLGYPNTTGLTTIDYRITDALTDPPGQTDQFHTENLLRIPGCFLCYQPPVKSPDVAELPMLSSGGITLGCFNNSTKISYDLIGIWSEILECIPGSRLVLKSHQFNDDNLIESLQDDFQLNEISIDRIEFIKHIDSFEAHLDLYNRIDIALDTYPYNGTTTTCEALWMGVPVVTLAGKIHRSRVGMSLLSAVGLDECIATSSDQYIEIVKSLSEQPDKLENYRNNLRQTMRQSVLTNARQFTTAIEDSYRAIWKQYCENEMSTAEAIVDHSDRVVSNLLALNMQGDIRIGVPANLNLMTPYIILEQEDWFEDEIKFIRKFLQPGMQCIDIGANFGTYSLTMASLASETGHVWSFEPAANIIPFLDWSIRGNNFENITLIQAGLSDRKGEAYLNIAQNSELNALVNEPGPGTKKIEITTLDDCLDEYHWEVIDFIKIDAEGHEVNVVAGGRTFLERYSPLVMFEIKQDEAFNLDLVRQFQQLGYQVYRLVPGIQALLPVDDPDSLDDSQLNLFCCKPDRAQSLKDDGLLIDITALSMTLPDKLSVTWETYLATFPYTRDNLNQWQSMGNSVDDHTRDYLLALSCYAKSKVDDPGIAYQYLSTSCDLLKALYEKNPNVPRMLSYARVLSDLGFNMKCIGVLNQLLNTLYNEKGINLDEPFLAVSPRFESIEPGNDLLKWCLAAVLEQSEKLRAYSSYFTGDTSLDFIERIQSLGFNTPEMERRKQLVLMRTGKQPHPEMKKIYSQSPSENLNLDYWKSRGQRT